MERLEAALAKARAARQQALVEPPNPGAEPLVLQPENPSEKPDWSVLPELKVNRRTINRGRLSALKGARDATPYDMLRARLLHQLKEKEMHRLAVTSPNTGCGKTTICLNLAFSLARHTDLRVLLMDFDMRRPSIARVMRQNKAGDISQLLNGETGFADHAMRYGDNLAICMNQRPVPRSAELLQSQRARDNLEALLRKWAPDIVIFDMPPMQGNDDTLGFIDRVDGVLLVAAAESTTISQIDVCERELSALTNVVGTVLNKCRYPDAEAGYGSGYY